LQAGTLRFGVLELGTPKQGKGAKLMQEERALEKFRCCTQGVRLCTSGSKSEKQPLVIRFQNRVFDWCEAKGDGWFVWLSISYRIIIPSEAENKNEKRVESLISMLKSGEGRKRSPQSTRGHL
jgi:hypothetical protein